MTAPGGIGGSGARSTRLAWRRLTGGLAGMLPHVAGGIALLSAPESYTVAAVAADGTCRTPDGPVDLADVYEARAFTPDLELRWVRRPAGGDGVLLGETLTGPDVEERRDLAPLDTAYLLWGERREPATGGDWTVLSSARAVPDTGGHATYDPMLRDGLPHLPATSVKGMLRAAYEAVTNSRFGVFLGHDSPLGHRMSAREGLAVVPARITDDGQSVELLPGTSALGPRPDPMYAAWLPRYRRAGGGKHGPPDPASNLAYANGSAPAHRDEVQVRLQLVQHHRWDARRQEHVEDFRFWQVTAIARRGGPLPPGAQVRGSRERRPKRSYHEPLPDTRTTDGWVCAGNESFSRKHDERVFFGTPEPHPLTEPLRRRWTELIEDYRAAHRHADIWERRDPRTNRRVEPSEWIGSDPGKTAWSRHLYADGAERLRAGDLCYARLDGRGEVQALFPVMIARELFGVSPAALLHRSLRPAAAPGELSPADQVFGWVRQGGKGAYRGQLRVGPVTFEGCADDVARFDGRGVPLAILGQPKPQQSRFYAAAGTAASPLPDRTPKRDWYVPGRTLRGRKVYLHHADLPATYWQNPTEDRTQQLDAGRYQEYRQPREAPDGGGLTRDGRAFRTTNSGPTRTGRSPGGCRRAGRSGPRWRSAACPGSSWARCCSCCACRRGRCTGSGSASRSGSAACAWTSTRRRPSCGPAPTGRRTTPASPTSCPGASRTCRR